MPAKSLAAGFKLTFHPLTPDRWSDVEQLFGSRGACGGCWCMYWRQSAKEQAANSGAGNKRRFKQLVMRDSVPGLLAYVGDQAVAWCAVRPREEFVRLEGSRVLAPVDDKPVWSIACFFIAKDFRRRGVSTELLKAVVKHVKKSGGKIVEGYPIDPTDKQPDAFVWTGIASAYEAAGFTEVARRSATRPIMRFVISR